MVASLQEGASKGGSEVSFLSYNLYCLPGVASLFAPSTCPHPAARAKLFGDVIPKYDVIALQELWEPRLKRVVKRAKQHSYHCFGSSSPSALKFVKGRFFGGGLMIMSKYPFDVCDEITYVRGTYSDSLTTKGAIYARVVTETTKIHVFNTHLQASYDDQDDPQSLYASIRSKQIQQLADFVRKMTADDNYPIMICGDFNVDARRSEDDPSDSEEYLRMVSILEGEHFKVVDVLKDENGGTHPSTHDGRGVVVNERSPPAQPQCLDFVLHLRRRGTMDHEQQLNFTKAQVEHFRVDGNKRFTQLSDHFGTSVVGEFLTTGGCSNSNISISSSTRTISSGGSGDE